MNNRPQDVFQQFGDVTQPALRPPWRHTLLTCPPPVARPAGAVAPETTVHRPLAPEFPQPLCQTCHKRHKPGPLTAVPFSSVVTFRLFCPYCSCSLRCSGSCFVIFLFFAVGCRLSSSHYQPGLHLPRLLNAQNHRHHHRR